MGGKVLRSAMLVVALRSTQDEDEETGTQTYKTCILKMGGRVV